MLQDNQLQVIEEECSRKKIELTLAEKRIRELQESLEQEMAASSDEDILLDDEYDSDDSLTTPQRRSFRRILPSLTKKASDFDTSVTSSSFLPRRSESSFTSVNGILGRDNLHR